MSDEVMRLLAAAYLRAVLRAASQALELVDLPDPQQTVRQLQALDQMHADLELLAVALMTQGGHSWASIAEPSGVARQTLHYRLNKKVLQAVSDAGRATPQDLRNAESEWKNLIKAIREAVDQLERTPLRGAASRVASGAKVTRNR